MPISVNGSSVTLNDIIQKNFREEFAERKLENDTMTNFGVDLMPLFVMDVVLPFQKFLLVPSLKQRLRRIRQSSDGNGRLVSLVIIDSSTGSIADFDCEVEITKCEPLPDGHFYLKIESCRRFRIIRSWDQDG
ncbi:unnamed protein product [Prunus armeniaca]